MIFDASPETLDRYSRTTLPFSHRPLGVARPQSRDEVREIVRWARETKTRLHPLSRGCNWGYGDAMAPRPEGLVVDLSGMNRILHVDETLAYAVIEPGVSQGQLFEFLRDHHPTLWMDANGAGPGASLLGNLLERGFGHTPLGDRASLCAGFEVVLGTGEVIRTGFGRFEGAHARHTYRHGVGPSLDGLFFQSNFGIVTQVTLWLQRRPEAFAAFSCRLADENRLPDLIDALRELRLSGVLRSCVHVGNALRSLTGLVPYPWELTDGRRPVPAQWVRAQCQALGLGAWNATGGLYGPREVVETSLAEVRRRLEPFGFLGLTDRDLERLDSRTAAAIGPAVGLLKGEPTSVYLRGAAWRSRKDRGAADPLENGAGLLWMVPTLPATGEHAARVVGIARDGLESAGFDAPVTLTLVNERTLLATTNISYDRASETDTAAAWECYRTVVPRLIAAGYPPYRSGIGGYDFVDPPGPESAVNGELKRLFDPDGILSPGRYRRES